MKRADLLKILEQPAKEMGYSIETNSAQYVVFLRKVVDGDRVQVAVYFSDRTAFNGRFTVATTLNHPKKGKNQLYRKNLTLEEVFAIMQKPRLHTPKGYRRRRK